CGSNLQVIAVAGQVEDLLPTFDPPDDLVDATGWALVGCAMHALLLTPQSEQRAFAALVRLQPRFSHARLRAFVHVLENFSGTIRGASAPSPPPSISLSDLIEGPDPDLVFIASILAGHLTENEGNVAAALGHLQRALDLCRTGDGPWMEANLHSQMANLQAQNGQAREAASHALIAIPTLERLHSVDTELMIAVLALNDLADGNLDRAAERIDSLLWRPQQGQAWPGGSVIGNVRAELELARGDIDGGLAAYTDTITLLREWQPPGVLVIPEFEPWILYPESVRLAAYVVHGRVDAARSFRDDLVTRTLSVLRGDYDFMDFPIAGTILFAIGMWEVAAGDARAGAELVALGRRFGYNQTMPSVAWSHAERLIDPVILARALEGLAGLDATQLRDRAQGLAAEL
ncbi:MAG: hypothetical protein L0H93_15190, partial [Nocardioides sp.]|nr:hypothetical protein [Nocardioides sp.]